MSTSANSSRALALLVEDDGIIATVLFDGLQTAANVGASLRSISTQGAEPKMDGLLARARESSVVADWEVPITTDSGSELCRLSATRFETHFFVIAVAGASDFYDVYGELMQINNEQNNQIRKAFKSMAHQSSERPIADDESYAELTRLTNELGAVQRSLAKKNVELQQLDERKNQILGMVAHDLRNPLGTVTGFSKIVLQRCGDAIDPKSIMLLERIRAASEFMLGMVDDLLDFSAIESGQIRLDTSDIQLEEFLKEIVSLAQPLASEKNTEIELETTNITLHADPRKLQQVVINLITNAIKFSAANGRIRVVGTEASEGLRISVVDEGQGIPAEEQSKLFKAFGTTSVRGTAGEKSTGLGLTIARKVVEAHGGTIGVESSVGVGSTFWFTVPTRQS